MSTELRAEELKVESAEEAEVRAHCEAAFKAIRLGRRPRRTWQNPKLRVEELKVESPAHLRGCPPEKDDQ